MSAPDIPRDIPEAHGYLEWIPLDQVDVTANVREDLGDLAELAASIAAVGVLEPIHVHPVGERYVVDIGHRRLAAAQLAGNMFIPAIVDQPRPDTERTVVQLVENLVRRDLNALEEARALRAILDAEPGLTQLKLGERIGRSQSDISNTLFLLELGEPVRELIAGGVLTGAHAKPLRGLAEKTQVEIARAAARDEVSAHGVEQLVKQHKRDEEWRKEREAAERKNAAANRAALEAGVANLAKKKVPLDAPIRVLGYGGAGHVVKLIAAAGYTDVKGVGYNGIASRPKGVACDCTAWKVTAEYSRVTISPGCVKDAHLQAKTAADDATRVAKYKLERAVQAKLAEIAPASVIASPFGEHRIQLDLRTARMALWHALDYRAADWAEKRGGKRGNPWASIAALDEEQLARELGVALAEGFRDRYGYHVPWAELGAEIGVVEEPEPAPAPAKRTRKAAAA